MAEALELPEGVDVLPAPPGRACPATWMVFCSDGERQALGAEAWPGADSRVDRPRLFTRRTWRRQVGWEVARGAATGKCAFRQPDGACEIMGRHAGLLPASCRQQPYRFVKCPDRETVTVGVDWSAVEVVPATGSPLERLRDEISALTLCGDGVMSSAPVAVQLGRRRLLSGWDELREAEETVVCLLSSPKIPLSVAVAGAAAVPRLAETFVALTARLSGGTQGYSLARYMRDQRGDGGGKVEPFRAQVAEVAGQIPDVRRGRRRLADAVTLLTAAATGRSRLATALELMGNQRRNRAGRDEYRWLALPEPGVAARLERVTFPIGTPSLAVVLRSYLVHVVRRQLLLPQAGLWRGLSLLATIFAMVREVSRALALADGATRVDAGHLRAAIGRVEATVALQEDVLAQVSVPGRLRKGLDRVFRPRNHAVSVVLPLNPQDEDFPVARNRPSG